MKCRGCARPLITRLEPEFTCYLRGSLYHHATHAMLPSCSLRKVRGLRKLIITIVYLTLLSCPTMAFPRKNLDVPETSVTENKNTITVHTTGCRPLTTEELRTLMGGAFDETKMAFDDEGMKRSSSLQSVINEDDDDSIGDSIETYLNDESDIDDISDLEEEGGTLSVQNRKFMRRKREISETQNTNLLSDNSFLYQNMLYDSISVRKSRRKRSYGSKFHPAWECKITNRWLHMSEGYFPTRILDGKCEQKSCFFGMYVCNPVKYSIKVLKRDPKDACRPLPLTNNQTTTYEESWVFKRLSVTVACECGTKSSRSKDNKKSRKRKKKKIRSKGRDE